MAVTFLLAACSGGSTDPVGGTRVPVDPLPGSQAEDLVVVLADGSSSPFDGDVRVPEVGSSETVRVVSVMDEDRAFGWLAPWPAWFDAEGSAVGVQQAGDRTIGPTSTAVQLVMGTPPLFTLDAVTQHEVVTVLAGLDEVLALADFLDVEAADGDPLEHDAYPSHLAAAVTAAVETLGAYEFDDTSSVAAREPTTPAVRLRTASQLGPSQGGDLPASSLSLDQVFTRIRPLEGELEVAWDSGVPRRERGLTYYGQLYRLDASQFADESAMRSHFLNAPWTTGVTLDATAEPVPIALPADTRWVYFDLVSTALNAIESRVLDESGIPLDEEGLYAAHLYSCSAGINLAEIVRENRRNDLELMRNWPSSEASMAAPCVMFVVESALNVLSVYVDLDEVLRDEQVVSLVKDVTATVVAAGDRVIQTRDMLPLIDETAKTAASMAVATLIDTGAERGVRGVGQVAFKNLAALLNIGNIISNGGQLGARLTAAAGMTPWEGVVVRVGDPWDTGSPSTHSLTIDVVGNGSVTSDPTGIDCGDDCSADFEDGTDVALTATPATGWRFDGWSGDTACAGGTVTMADTYACTATFVEGDAPSGVSFESIAAGWSHSAALDSDGKPWAWGRDDDGQLGDGGDGADQSAPVQVAAPSGVSFTAIQAGDQHVLALDASGDAWAWGDNGHGQVGDGTTTDRLAPVRVEMPSGVMFTSIAAGGEHSAALDADGNAWTWGRNRYGRLGDGTTVDRSEPVRVSMPSGVSFAEISVGGGYSLALDRNGNAWGWGRNFFGQLGDGSNTDRSTPVGVIMPEATSFASISTGGGGHSLALDGDGRAWSWGRNAWGQLGDGTTVDRGLPVDVALPTDVTLTSLKGGWHFSLALDSSGDAWAWGRNTYGQLGDGSTTDRSLPVVASMPAGTEFTLVAAGGDDHTVALSVDGDAWAWGSDEFGQLGDGGGDANQDAPVPVDMP